ncbi:MAG TPA: hypothetical protein VLW85_17885, partial [Myxococcales bacterium]|nr:hypothetical protein [Myxococcales bacterium]
YYPMWVSTDGAQLLTAAGTRFRTQDLTYAGTMALPGGSGSSYVNLAWADPSPDGAHWLVAPAPGTLGTPGDDTFVAEVDSQYLASPTTVPYPPFVHASSSYPLHGVSVFYDSAGTHKIAVTRIDTSAGALLDFVVVVL